jgi:hypothetical protein
LCAKSHAFENDNPLALQARPRHDPHLDQGAPKQNDTVAMRVKAMILLRCRPVAMAGSAMG